MILECPAGSGQYVQADYDFAEFMSETGCDGLSKPFPLDDICLKWLLEWGILRAQMKICTICFTTITALEQSKCCSRFLIHSAWSVQMSVTSINIA